MKLYTEEQLNNTVNAIQYYIIRYGIDSAQERIIKHVKVLQPIELPTDEEIESKAESFSVGFPISPNAECGEAYRLGLNDGYFNGTKWVLEQIKN